jgi:hypothetical protein
MSSFFGIDKDYGIISVAKSRHEGKEIARVRAGISPTRRTRSRESFAGFFDYELWPPTGVLGDIEAF